MSKEKDQDYFCEGVAEEILNTLSQLKELRVIARTSAFSFKGKDVPINTIGETLNVETVLEGSIRKEGNNLRITAQLIKVDDESHLWSDTYDRDLESVFAIQSEIAMAIVEALKGELLGADKKLIEKQKLPTENIDAYDLYLLGRLYWNKWDPSGFKYFEQAIEMDPSFAVAYVEIGDVYATSGYAHLMPPKEVYPLARNYVKKALAIDSSLAEAHTLSAWISFCYDRDWIAAKNGFEKAIELNSNYAYAYQGFAYFLMIMGRYDEALVKIEKAIELDPISLRIHFAAMELYFLMGNYDKASEHYRIGKSLFPNSMEFDAIFIDFILDLEKYTEVIEIIKNMNEEVIKAINKYIGFDYQNTFISYCNFVISGKSKEAEKVLKDILSAFIEQKKERFTLIIASLYIELKDNNNAFIYLNKAFEERNPKLHQIKSWPQWEPIRHDPRFKALLRKMGLPED